LTDRKQVLVVIGRSDETGAKSVRNLPGVHILTPDQLNTYMVCAPTTWCFRWRRSTPTSGLRHPMPQKTRGGFGLNGDRH